MKGVDRDYLAFDTYDYYDLISLYEEKYGYSSEELLKKWEAGEVESYNADINDWIMKYLQIRDFINNKDA